MGSDQLKLFYQPKVNVATGQIYGTEALLRWQNDQLGQISPGQFIPVAEATGVIHPLGEWALQEACKQATEWQRQGLPPLSMAVNISPVQFKHQNFKQVIANVLRETELEPALLDIEITETTAMQTGSKSQFRELKEMGVVISIDDFGTGYSSLSQLNTFTVDRLKIDRSFVRSIDRDDNRKAICSAIVKLAKCMSLRVIAEGVETLEEYEVIKEIGCDELQGYLCSPALPAAEFVEFYQTYKPIKGFGDKRVPFLRLFEGGG